MAKPDKITIEPGKYATVVRLHHGAESDLWRKGPYKRERTFASPETATEHARRAFPGVPVGLKANRRRLRRNYDDLHREWDRVNYEQRLAEKSGDYKAIERAKAETRRVYNELRMKQLTRNHSTNREGLSYEQWAHVAGLGRRSVPGAHAAWLKGKNPESWGRMFAVTLAANPGMDAAQFCEAVNATADLNGKTLWCQHESRLSGERHDTVYMNFINLTPERVKEKRGGGAEAENNRVHLRVEGFARQLGEPPPTGKVKFETMSAYPHKPLRGKTAAPEAIVKYVADYLSKIAATPSNLTHANPRRRTSRKKKRTSRRRR